MTYFFYSRWLPGSSWFCSSYPLWEDAYILLASVWKLFMPPFYLLLIYECLCIMCRWSVLEGNSGKRLCGSMKHLEHGCRCSNWYVCSLFANFICSCEYGSFSRLVGCIGPLLLTSCLSVDFLKMSSYAWKLLHVSKEHLFLGCWSVTICLQFQECP